MKDRLDKVDGKLYIKVAVWSLSEVIYLNVFHIGFYSVTANGCFVSLRQHREKQKYTVAVEYQARPEQIIREAIFKRIRHSDACRSQEEKIKVGPSFVIVTVYHSSFFCCR